MIQPNHRVALITGASSGLGMAFARRLAMEGYGLVLVARRQARLESLAEELGAAHGTPARILVADLASEQGIARVEATIRDSAAIDLLVNNAGFGMRGNFATIPIERHLEMLQVHVTASIRLVHAALPGMLHRRSGTIINVASVAGLLPLRNVSYGASKAYLVAFSQALSNEVGPKNVRVQALCPGFVRTEFHDHLEKLGFHRSHVPPLLWGDADWVVQASLRGLRRNQVIVIPGVFYKLAVGLGRSRLIIKALRAATDWFTRRQQ